VSCAVGGKDFACGEVVSDVVLTVLKHS
jgi:hypothetical protein